MRIIDFYLSNFIGIYNGMNLKSIHIDFSKATHNVCIIHGANGSGKSTIFRALSPLPDENCFIPNTIANKSITYRLDDGRIIKICYEYQIKEDGSKAKSKCSIIDLETNQNLNPNLNINQAKEIIKEIFGIDNTYMELSQLSSDNRGLADKKPSERKRFINSIMESLDSYNVIYKNLSKKISALNTIINSYSERMKSVGDIKLLTARIEKETLSLGEVEDNKTLLLSKLGANKEKLESLNYEEIQNSYREKVSLLVSKKKSISSYTEFPTRSSIEQAKKDADTNIIITNSDIQHCTELIKDKRNQILNLNQKKDEYEIKSSSVLKEHNYSYLISERDKLEEEQEQIKQVISSSSVFKSFIPSKDESIRIKTTLEQIQSGLEFLDNYTNESGVDVKRKLDEFVPNPNIDEDISRIKNQIESISNDIVNVLSLIKASELLSTIPDECNLQSICPFTKNAIKAKAELSKYKDYDILCEERDNLKSTLQDLSDMKSLQFYMNGANEVFKNIFNIIKSNIDILCKIGFEFNNDMNIKNWIIYNNSVEAYTEEFLSKNVYLEKYEQNKESLKSIYEELKLIESSDTKFYIQEIDRITKEIDTLNKSITELEERISADNNNISAITLKLQEFDNLLSVLDIKDEIDTLDKEVSEMETKFNEIQNIKQVYDRDVDNLKRLMQRSTEINEELNNDRHQLATYNDCKIAYEQNLQKYNKMVIIRKYSSPTTGIQTVLMNMYLNDIIDTSNNLLSMLFNGEFVLYPFIINDSEFRIPCLGKGLMNDDISSMSTSQICMIGMIISFALLHKASSTYNIIKLDEMDGGLDTNNRLQFIILLKNMMNIMNYEQCIMISHNSELNYSDSDLVLLNPNPSEHIEGNIIFSNR